MANTIESIMTSGKKIGNVYCIEDAERAYLIYREGKYLMAMFMEDIPLDFIDFDNMRNATGWMKIPFNYVVHIADTRKLEDFIYGWKVVNPIFSKRYEGQENLTADFLEAVCAYFGGTECLSKVTTAVLEAATFTFLADSNKAMEMISAAM